MDIHQYGGMMFTEPTRPTASCSTTSYTQRDSIQRMRHRSADLLEILANTSDRIARKLALQHKELEDCADRERWKMCGNLISANLYPIQKGDRAATVVNFCDEQQAEITIPLDPRKTPSQMRRNTTANTARQTPLRKLRQLIEEGQQEAEYIDSVFDALTRAQTNDELSAIRSELVEQGYTCAARDLLPKKAREARLAHPSATYPTTASPFWSDATTCKTTSSPQAVGHSPPKAKPMVGICGSTQKHPRLPYGGAQRSRGRFPTAPAPGSHFWAAANSKAADSAQVPVDYTLIKNVKKPRGAKPGMVTIVEAIQTAYATPRPELEKRLLVE